MTLTGYAIHQAVLKGEIVIDPFDEKNINPNSYNLTLSNKLAVYTTRYGDILHSAASPMVLDPKCELFLSRFTIPEKGFVMSPDKIYLGSTVEVTGTNYYVPVIEGRSSFARLGLSVHKTGGFGDIGFSGTWTLELSCIEPIVLYPGLKIAQIVFQEPYGDIDRLYVGKYQSQLLPTESRINNELSLKDNNLKQ